MASELKNLSEYDFDNVPSAEDLRFGIVVTDYHHEITFSLLEACRKTLLEHGAKVENIVEMHVAGSYELPLGAKLIYTQNTKLNAVICLGCVITGETKHDEYINSSVAQGIMNLNLFYTTPFVFGLLTPRTEQQAKDRAGGKHGNKGTEAAITAIKMADLARAGNTAKRSMGFGRNVS